MGIKLFGSWRWAEAVANNWCCGILDYVLHIMRYYQPGQTPGGSGGPVGSVLGDDVFRSNIRQKH